MTKPTRITRFIEWYFIDSEFYEQVNVGVNVVLAIAIATGVDKTNVWWVNVLYMSIIVLAAVVAGAQDVAKSAVVERKRLRVEGEKKTWQQAMYERITQEINDYDQKLNTAAVKRLLRIWFSLKVRFGDDTLSHFNGWLDRHLKKKNGHTSGYITASDANIEECLYGSSTNLIHEIDGIGKCFVLVFDFRQSNGNILSNEFAVSVEDGRVYRTLLHIPVVVSENDVILTLSKNTPVSATDMTIYNVQNDATYGTWLVRTASGVGRD